MSTETFGKRLKHARKVFKKITQENLEAVTGVPQSTISKLERDEQSGSTDVALLADGLGVRAIWLSHGYEPMTDKKITVNLSSVLSEQDDVVVYQYFDSRCAVGPNYEADGNANLTTLKIAKATLDEQGISPESAFGFIQPDNSMGEGFAAGCQAIVNSIEIDPRSQSGKIFIIDIGGTLIARRIVAQIDGLIVSCDSQEKSLFPDEKIKNGTLLIIGRVAWASGAK